MKVSNEGREDTTSKDRVFFRFLVLALSGDRFDLL